MSVTAASDVRNPSIITKVSDASFEKVSNVMGSDTKSKHKMKKVKKMINDGIAVVRCSDKGNTLTISDIESYIRQGREHTVA